MSEFLTTGFISASSVIPNSIGNPEGVVYWVSGFTFYRALSTREHAPLLTYRFNKSTRGCNPLLDYLINITRLVVVRPSFIVAFMRYITDEIDLSGCCPSAYTLWTYSCYYWSNIGYSWHSVPHRGQRTFRNWKWIGRTRGSICNNWGNIDTATC